MSNIYMYVVDRDFGFAPNPFHGYCTLATCKPKIRNNAEVEDWVIGMGGSRLNATGRCIFAMRVTEKITFNEYWTNPIFLDKKPIRNGSQKMMVGDNIYYHDSSSNEWSQADSHHSKVDGSVNLDNLKKDISSNKVLVSQHFLYFGREAPVVPHDLLNTIGYENRRNHRVFNDKTTIGINSLIEWLHNQGSLNQVIGDPFDFSDSEKRYSVNDNKVS
ncbi:Nmad2 family putative nucleotide modification protein [Microcoleus sp. SVA1_A1]|uniref:Nmad2 family putative nucleotide modification protein n=1 Tax=Microcoleus sp. SVA1_A1 TaxID=2818946 RepID=UPI002FD69522